MAEPHHVLPLNIWIEKMMFPMSSTTFVIITDNQRVNLEDAFPHIKSAHVSQW
jgi:hypothetical protein